MCRFVDEDFRRMRSAKIYCGKSYSRMPEKNLPGFQAWRNNLREPQSFTPAIVPRIFSTGLQKQSEQNEKYPTFQFVKLRRNRAQNEGENSENIDALWTWKIFSVRFDGYTFHSPARSRFFVHDSYCVLCKPAD